MKIAITCAIALFIGAAGPVLAQSSSQQKDDTFVKQAASGGMAEVKLGELAQQKGIDVAVRNFGIRMQTDHSAADNQLKGIASRDKLALPSGMNSQDQTEYNRLSSLSGTAFDRAYAQAMVRDHEKDIAAFRQEGSSGQNPDVKTFAAQTLPTLEDHLQEAQSMEESVGTAGEKSSSSTNSSSSNSGSMNPADANPSSPYNTTGANNSTRWN